MKLKLNQICKHINFKQSIFKTISRNFRDWRAREDMSFSDNRYTGGKMVSPYQPQFSISEEEREANNKLPVHERVMDFNKYMFHKGELKYSTGTYLIDVEPFPRLKIMLLCHIILDLLKEFDNNFLYKKAVKENTIFIMEIVDQNEVLVDIENALIHYQNLEKLIMKLDGEISLLRGLIKKGITKPMEMENYKDEELLISAMLYTKKMDQNTERKTHMKNERPDRTKI